MEFWKTEHWKEYLLNSKHAKITDWSFDDIILIQEGQELYSTGFPDDKDILNKIRRVALENSVRRIYTKDKIKTYLDVVNYTCILDLDNIRPTKGHKSAIKKGHKNLEFELNPAMYAFMKDYFRIAGKVTRPEKTFVILDEWIEQGFGTLLKALHQDNTAGYVYILHYLDEAYYFMSCIEPEYREFNVTHYLQDTAFELLRAKGVKTYELGEQVRNSLISQPTQKELNISHFKRNFGGSIVAQNESEYFFDKEYMEKTFIERIKAYCGAEYISTTKTRAT